MKTIILLLAFLGLTFLSPSSLSAQSLQPSATDSIPLESLLKKIESATTYRIYSDAPSSFAVFAKYDISSPILVLSTIFENTPYKVSVFGDNIFILKEKIIKKDLVLLSTKKESLSDLERNRTSFLLEKTETATSENLVYAVGDRKSVV